MSGVLGVEAVEDQLPLQNSTHVGRCERTALAWSFRFFWFAATNDDIVCVVLCVCCVVLSVLCCVVCVVCCVLCVVC